MMKRRAELVMAPPKGVTKTDPRARGAGRLLMDALRARLSQAKANPEDPWGRLRLTLVGHSMGTMILNQLLEEYGDLEFDRIVYLAAAASIDDVRGAVLPYLRRHPNATFWGFNLAETRESQEFNGPDVFERGSLLVWIDHLFERLNAPGNRTFGRARNLREYFEVPEKWTQRSEGGRRRFFLVKFNRGEHDPQKHADFSKPDVLERVLVIVEAGCR